MRLNDFLIRKQLTTMVAVIVVAGFGSVDGQILFDGRAPTAKELVQTLGDDNFARRQWAQKKLRDLGLEAIEAFREADNVVDVEVELTIAYLAQNPSLRWDSSDDPPTIRRLLSEYGSLSLAQRKDRIEQLAKLQSTDAAVALSRLSRYEASDWLSDTAAVEVISMSASQIQQAGAESGDGSEGFRSSEYFYRASETLGECDRDAAKWLRQHLVDLERGQVDFSTWRQLVDHQKQRFNANQIDNERLQPLVGLVRSVASQASVLQQSPEATQFVVDYVSLIAPTTETLVETTDWALRAKMDRVILQLEDRFSRFFREDSTLRYAYAESLKRTGNESVANEVAAEALKLDPFGDPDGDQDRPPSERQLATFLDAHIDTAMRLSRRGLFKWSNAEFDQILEKMPITRGYSLRIRYLYVRQLSDNLDYDRVVELLAPVIEDGDQRKQIDAELRQMPTGPQLENFKALYLFAKSQAEKARLEEEQYREALMKAYVEADENRRIDNLIEMYRTDGPTAWREKVLELLGEQTREAEADIRRRRRTRGSRPDQLAHALNNYAWLISNTEGDLELALESSLESLEIEVDEAKLDTCGRCFFALKKYAKAVEYQQRAVDLFPHSPPLLRQLKQFKEALAESETETQEELPIDEPSQD
ncbi:MAG: hypothetical protein AAF664_06035 [Planctomycetota bacterium]